MDALSFDRLTTRLSRIVSRRAAIGGLGVLIGPGLVEARKKRKRKKKCKKKCGPCQTCNLQKGKCKPKPVGTSCGTGKQCFASGTCVACDVCASGCRAVSLQAALVDAPDGATIQLCPGRFATNASIAKDVTIIGAGAGTDGTILDGQGMDRVLSIAPTARVDMRHLRITGGFGSAAGIDYRGAALTLNSVAIVGNTSEGGAGGIYIDGDSTVTLTDCEISGNRAEGGGGGGGIFINGESTVTLTDCQISGNTAVVAGGGILITAGSTVTLTSCEISGNTAAFGGGIHNAGDATTLSDSHVTGNTATSQGGGIYNNSGTVLVIDGSSVTDNTPDNCAGTPAC